LKLSAALETILKDDYAREIEAGDNIFNALSDADKDALKQDELCNKLFIKARSDAENSMREGNFSLAHDNAIQWECFLSARQRNQEFIKALNATTIASVIDSVSEEIISGTKELSENLSFYARSKSWTNKAHASEVDDYCRELPASFGAVDIFSFQMQPLLEERKKIADTKSSFWDIFKSGPSHKEQLDTLDQQILGVRTIQLLFVNVGRDYFQVEMRLMEKFATLYKEYSPAPQSYHMDCENLVYNASSAADESFTADTIQELAKQAGIDVDEAKTRIAMNSWPYYSLVSQRKLCGETHQTLKEKHDFYSIALATQDHGFALAAATRLALAVQCGWDGNHTYSNTGLVRSLLDSSRNEAVTAIGRCESVGIPCWNPIMLVLSADGKREDTSEDRMDILESYLQAGVQGRILNLLFSTTALNQK
jgi:hypothetical protein